VSDTRKFKVATGWAPKVNVGLGVQRLHRWFLETRGLAAAPQLPVLGGFDAVLTH
jgi:CDP-paratose 2-epimerase